ncbi:hypothetical protein EUX98_g8442 [Antrodiella citrinella]|uniref:Uncharacterized protein n=1 Tax=Antrodiella citrinella TaxID=2447956 RepID=A0A4S4M7M5_9APHY|nr:hypothetical protein EUX98_g8442 [Antrodiella citrinella]
MEFNDDSEMSEREADVDMSTRILLAPEEVLRIGERKTLREKSFDDEDARMVEGERIEEDESMDQSWHPDATEDDLEHDRFELDAAKVRGRRRRTTCERIKDASESGSLREEVRVIIWQRMFHAKEYRKCLDMIFEKLKEIRALTAFSCSSVMPPGPTLRLEELRRFSTTLELLQLSNVAYLPRALSGFDGPIRLERLRRYVGPVMYMQQIDAPVLERLFVSSTLQEVMLVDDVLKKLKRIRQVEVLLTGGVESEYVVADETDDVWMEATAFLLEMIKLEVVKRLPWVFRTVTEYMTGARLVLVVTTKHEIRWSGKAGTNGKGWEYSVWEDVTEESDMKALMNYGLVDADGEYVVPDE